MNISLPPDQGELVKSAFYSLRAENVAAFVYTSVTPTPHSQHLIAARANHENSKGHAMSKAFRSALWICWGVTMK